MSSDPADLQAVLDAELAYLHHHRHSEQHDPAIVRRSPMDQSQPGEGGHGTTKKLPPNA